MPTHPIAIEEEMMSHPFTRRGFLHTGLGAALGAVVAPRLLGGATASRKEKRMLILGGTRFLGPRIVRAAWTAGWDVTLFNRGRSNPTLFPELEKIRGDRDKDELDGLRDRHFDVVVDTSGYVPAHVEKAAEILAPNIERYIFVSSVSVYEESAKGRLDESTPVTTLSDEVLASVKTIRESFPHYSGMKAHCELAAEAAMPGRATQVRPGLIVGPDDGSDRFTYWPVRVARGGEVLAPGNPEALQQFVDVRDLGRWIVRLADDRRTGVFNAVGFEGPVTMEELLHGMKIVIGTDTRFTWISEEFLSEQGVGAWMEMPLWLPDEMVRYYENARAIEAGLTFRPIGSTIRDTLRWHDQTRGESHTWRAGLAAEKEARVLKAWHERTAAGL